jgi:hypothetical protein
VLGLSRSRTNGEFRREGNSIENLTIDCPNENRVGLFGDTSGSAVIDERILTGATVTGSADVGGLVGDNEGTVSESFATGAVTGSTDVAGLVGQLGAESLDPGEEAILRDSYYDTQVNKPLSRRLTKAMAPQNSAAR